MSGHIELQYTGGLLTCILMAIKQPLNDVQFTALVSVIRQREDEIDELKKLNLVVTAAMPANKKIALFCGIYETFKGIKYKVSPADSGKIKLIKIDEPMLTAYFKSENFLFKGKHSISNLVKYYNELLAEIAAGPASKFPDHWSKAFEDKLKDDDRKDYWKHLRELGLKPQRDRFGAVTDWYMEISQ